MPAPAPTGSFPQSRGDGDSSIPTSAPQRATLTRPRMSASAKEEEEEGENSNYRHHHHRRRRSSGSGPLPAEAGYVPLNVSSLSSHEAANLTAVVQHGDDDHDDHAAAVVAVAVAAVDGTSATARPAAPSRPDLEEEGERGRENRRRRKFLQVLEGDHAGTSTGTGAAGGGGGENVDLAELRKLAWSGVPNELRPMVWQLLLVSPSSPLSRFEAAFGAEPLDFRKASTWTDTTCSSASPASGRMAPPPLSRV